MNPTQTLTGLHGTPTPHPFTRGILMAIILAYLGAFILVLINVGPGEALRRVFAEGIILSLWLWSAHRLLRHQPILDIPIKRPRLELSVGVLVVVLGSLAVTGSFLRAGWLAPLVGLLTLLVPLATVLALRYDRPTLGLAIGPRQGWLAAALMIAINIGIGLVGNQLLPPAELPTPPGQDLAESISTPQDVVVLLAYFVSIAALPEEFFFRVYLQSRLERYVPAGWAILIQAVLFTAMHTPRNIIRLGYAWPLALAEALTISNGLLGGYFWRQTRSLPILLVLHLFAYIRVGL
jgi:membrane protease YdiL (CAAX protease family)